MAQDGMSIFEGLAGLAPKIMAGLANSPEALQSVYQRQQAIQQEEKRENLSKFGRELFGMGDISQLTPELLAQKAQKYNVAPQEAMSLVGNFMQYRKARRGDQVPVSLPMEDGRVRTASVYESELPQFLEANPNAMQGQISGQKETRFGPIQTAAPGGALRPGTSFVTDSRGMPHILQAPPVETEAQKAAAAIANLQLATLNSLPESERKYAWVKRPNAGRQTDPYTAALNRAKFEKAMMELTALQNMSDEERKQVFGGGGRGGKGGPNELSWNNALTQIEKNFSKMTPMGSFGVTADDAGKYQVALAKAQQLRQDGAEDPLAVANEATRYAQRIESNYWQVYDAAPPGQKEAVRRSFKKQYGYEPLLQR